MIIVRTPLRISFVGGGSDCEWFYSKHPGAVISTTIDKYVTIAVYKSYSGRYSLHYKKREEVDNLNEIKNELFRETLRYSGIKDKVEVHSMADIPSNSGLGSSSAFCVALLQAFGIDWPLLAEEASHVEIDILDNPIGKQDQYASVFGGFNLTRFYKDGVTVDALKFDKDALLKNLYLYDTGIRHNAKKIHQGIKHDFKTMKKMVELVNRTALELKNGNIDYMGQALHENWMLKKSLGKISNRKIDGWYYDALEQGALGGKLLGAGGGGFLLFYSKNKLNLPLKKVGFKFSNKGSEVVYDGNSNRCI